MKKTISLVLTIFILICSIPSVSAFSLGGSSGDCTWELDGTTLVISGNGAMSNFDRVSAPWGKEITEVVIQNGVTTIGQYAFADCKKLVSVSLPESLQIIRENAFDGCISLNKVTIPNSVKEVKASAFFGCTSLEVLVLPNSISTVAEYAFYNCASLKSVVLGSGITSVGYKGFYGCIALTDIFISQKTKSVSISAFDGCASLENVWFGGTEIDKDAIRISNKNTTLTGANWNFSAAFSIKKEPDCTQNGLLEIGCASGISQIISLPKTPHDFSKWAVEDAAECDKNGVLARKCFICSYKETKQIEALGHNFGDWQTHIAPSCEKEGAEKRVCSVCKAQENRVVAALGHNYNILVGSNSASCSQGGQTTLKCSVCRNNSVTQTTSGHVYKNGSCIYCDIGAKVVESKHNYDSNCDIKQKISFPSAQKLTISFSKSTYTEAEYDFIYIIDSKGNIKSKNSGGMLSGRTITVDGNTVTIHLQTDESGEEYGYFATVTPHSLLGDTDGNGTLDALDVSGVMNGVLTGDNNLCFDINDDGLVNLVDLIRIKKLLTA